MKKIMFLGLCASSFAAFAANEMTYSFAWYSGPMVTDFQAPITLHEG